MAFASAAPSPHVPGQVVAASGLRPLVFALFLIFGGITSLNDVLIPKLKGLFALNYTEVMLVQFAFFLAYLLVSAPAGVLVQRLGYVRAAVIGLLTMMAGCLLFIPASAFGVFPAFLAALFVLAAGITMVQVVANPLICLLGAPQLAHSRLSFAQGFNSVGTTVFPYLGALLILRPLAAAEKTQGAGTYNPAEAALIDHTYLGLALALLAMAAVAWTQRNRLPRQSAPAGGMLRSLDLLRRPRLAFGAAGIFIYVGAEVAIGSLLANYLMQPDTLALTPQAAGQRVSLYWGGALLGRFVGAELLRRLPPPRVLAVAALGAVGLLLVSGFSHGLLSGVALILVGLFNSVMFPTIFSLAAEGLGERTPEGSGLLCMAIVGGAIVPVLTGLMADATSLRGALLVPLLCYAGILGFARYCRLRPA